MSEQTLEPSSIEAFINAFQSIGGGEYVAEVGEKMRECIKATMLEGLRLKYL